MDRGNELFSSRNSPRPAISPRTLGQLPMTLNPQKIKKQWINKADQVLRFYAFFKEAVLDSAAESFRVRKVCILFYLSDGTLEITEMKVSNSGIGGGTFLKRSHVPHTESGRVLAKEDFAVGGDVEIFGRKFHVFDCDNFTRSVMPDQGNREDCPIDSFTATIDSPVKPPMDASYSSRYTPRKNRWLKNTFGITGSSTLSATSSNGGEVEEPVKILRYYAKWIDDEEDAGSSSSSGSSKGEQKPEVDVSSRRKELYKIHYYLEDGSLEILVSNKGDLAYQLFPVLLNRQMATKAPMVSVTDIGTDKSYLTPEDFEVGKECVIQKRRMLIYKADERTYRYAAARR